MYMGIDPSTSSTGIAIFSEEGELLFSDAVRGMADDAESFHKLYSRLDELIVEYKVKKILFESQFGGNNPKTLIKLVRPTGVVLAVGGKHGLSVEQKMPASWRKVFHDVCGKVEKGNPKKTDTFRVVKERFGVVTSYKKDNDISDAIGIGYCLFLTNKEA